jgi:hypothetical protein
MMALNAKHMATPQASSSTAANACERKINGVIASTCQRIKEANI